MYKYTSCLYCIVPSPKTDKTTTYVERAYVPLQLCTYDINVENYLVEQRLTCEYKNTSDSTIETIYGFPLHDTVVYDFEATIGDKVIKTQLCEKKEAEEKYKKAKEEGKKVVMMSKDGCDMFTCSVGNLSPGQSCTIVIKSCHQLTEGDNFDNFQLSIPLTVTPRYDPSAQYEDKTSNDIPFACFSRNPFVTSMPYEIKVQGNIKMNCDNITIKALSSNLNLSNLQPNSLSFNFDNITRGEDIVISITRSSAGSFLLSEHNETSTDPSCTYTHLLNLVPLPENINIAPIQDTDYVILADRSGSMEGPRLKQMKIALQILLEALPDDCGMTIYAFDDKFIKFTHSDATLNDSFRTAAKDWISKITDNGGTEFVPILQQAITDLTSNGRPNKNIFFLTDGDVSNYNRVMDVGNLAKSTKIRIFPLGIGNGCSKELLNDLARVTDGSAAYVKDNEDMLRKLAQHVRKSRTVYTPMNINVVTEGNHEIINKSGMNCLYPDSNNLFFITSTNPITKIILNEQEILPSVLSNGPLTKLVGKRIIDTCEDKETIIRTSLNMGVLCKYTNFIGVEEVTENEKKQNNESPKKILIPLPNVNDNYPTYNEPMTRCMLESACFSVIPGKKKTAKKGRGIAKSLTRAAAPSLSGMQVFGEMASSVASSNSTLNHGFYEYDEDEESEGDMGFGCFDDFDYRPNSSSSLILDEIILPTPTTSEKEWEFGSFDGSKTTSRSTSTSTPKSKPTIKTVFPDLPDYTIVSGHYVGKKEGRLGSIGLNVGDFIEVTGGSNAGIYEIICIGSDFEKWILKKL
jgi:Ca-activated chloride channel family protein